MSENSALTPEEIKALKDFLNLSRALTGSLTSSQIVNLASSLGDIIALLQTLNDPNVQKLIKTLAESSETLVELISLLDTYHKSGAIRSAFELVTLLGTVRNAFSTQTVARLAEDANNLMVAIDQLAAECGGIAGIGAAIKAVKEASKEAAQDNSGVGMIGLLKALKEPQIQKGIKFLLHLAKNLDK